MTRGKQNGASLRRHLLRGRHAARLHDDLDRVLDAILGVADCGGQVVERKGVRVDLGGVESLLAHECFGAMGRALAFAANAIDVDVVAHDLRDVDRRLLVREGGEADFAAAVDHADSFVDGIGRAGTLEHVVDAFAAVEAAHRLDRILLRHVDHVVRAKVAADPEPVVARPGQDYGLRAERLGDRDTKKPDRTGPRHGVALSSDIASGMATRVLMLLTWYSQNPPSVVKPLAR